MEGEAVAAGQLLRRRHVRHDQEPEGRAVRSGRREEAARRRRLPRRLRHNDSCAEQSLRQRRQGRAGRRADADPRRHRNQGRGDALGHVLSAGDRSRVQPDAARLELGHRRGVESAEGVARDVQPRQGLRQRRIAAATPIRESMPCSSRRSRPSTIRSARRCCSARPRSRSRIPASSRCISRSTCGRRATASLTSRAPTRIRWRTSSVRQGDAGVKISIIVPLFDRRNAGWKSLESALAQRYPRDRYEVVAVTTRDGAEMRDPAVGALLARCDAVARTDLDPAITTNEVELYRAGHRCCTGDLVFFCEGHTVLHEDCCSLIDEHFVRTPRLRHRMGATTQSRRVAARSSDRDAQRSPSATRARGRCFFARCEQRHPPKRARRAGRTRRALPAIQRDGAISSRAAARRRHRSDSRAARDALQRHGEGALAPAGA